MALYKNSFGNNVYFVSCYDIDDDIGNIIKTYWPHNYVSDYRVINIPIKGRKYFVICMDRNVYPFLKNNVPFHISPYVTTDVAGIMQ